MATKFQFREEPEPVAAVDKTTALIQAGIRGLGVVLVLIGLGVGLRVIGEAWGLYRHPERIAYFVEAIERGSNLDQLTVPRPPGDSAVGDEELTAPPFRLAYFAAWVIVIVLLLLVGRLALAAVHVGGQLALYDATIKKLTQELLEVLRKASRG
jgi:hypothetical protein